MSNDYDKAQIFSFISVKAWIAYYFGGSTGNFIDGQIDHRHVTLTLFGAE